MKSIKAPLQKVIGQGLLRIQELTTVLTEIEALINARPLTHEGDILDEPAVTPAMLSGQMWQSGIADNEIIDTNRPELCKADMVRRARHVQNVTEHLKTRWQEEYVAQLRLFGSQHSASRQIAVGEVVYAGNAKMKRQHWKLGLVTKVFTGKDGNIRVAEIKIGNKSFIRAVQNLVALEVTTETATEDLQAEKTPQNNSTVELRAEEQLTRTRTRIVKKTGSVNLLVSTYRCKNPD